MIQHQTIKTHDCVQGIMFKLSNVDRQGRAAFEICRGKPTMFTKSDYLISYFIVKSTCNMSKGRILVHIVVIRLNLENPFRLFTLTLKETKKSKPCGRAGEW